MGVRSLSESAESGYNDSHKNNQDNRRQTEHRHRATEAAVLRRTLPSFGEQYNNNSGYGREQKRDDESEEEAYLSARSEKSDNNREERAG